LSHRKPSQTNAGVALKSQTTAWGGGSKSAAWQGGRGIEMEGNGQEGREGRDRGKEGRGKDISND